MSPREIISPQLEIGTDRPTDRFDQIQRDEAALSRSKRPKSTRFDQKDDQFHRKNSRFNRMQVRLDRSEIQTTELSADIVNPFWFVFFNVQGDQFPGNDLCHIELTVLNTIC